MFVIEAALRKLEKSECLNPLESGHVCNLEML